jgi:peptide/nickel transport system substrate-binding protein
MKGVAILKNHLTRRSFLSRSVGLVGATAGAVLLSACGQQSPPVSPTAAAIPTSASAPIAASAATSSPAPTAAPAATTAPVPTKSSGANPTPAGQAGSGSTFTYGNSKPAKNIINPLNTIGTGQNVLIEALFLRLVYGRQWGDGMNPQKNGPIDLAVAETMKEIEKDRVWDFTIRKNVKWHDGHPVTVDDVIFGIWLSLNKNAKTTNETPVVGIKGGKKLQEEGAPVGEVHVDGATKIDDNTLRIELERPVANYWVNWSVGYWPMPKHIFGNTPFDKLFDEPYATKPIGNGPFKAVKYVDGQYMEMAANPDFYLGKPKSHRFIVRFGDADTLSAAMEAQEIDGTSVSVGPVYDHLASLPYIVGNPVPTSLPNGFVVNAGHIKEHAELTKAIMYALDVPTLNKQLYSNTLYPSNYLFEHIVGYETAPAGFPRYSYDPDKARAILKQVNWDPSRELQWVMWGKPSPATDAMQAMLAAVGIKTRYKIIDVATVIDELYRKYDYDLVFANFSGDQDLQSVWKYIKCGWDYDHGGYNYASYCDHEVDELWQKGLDEIDASKQHEIFDQVSLKLAADPPQATLWRGSVAYVWNKRVKGAYPYQYRLPVRPALERVWVEPK